MRGFEKHEVPRGAFEVPASRLASLRRPVSGSAFLCAEQLSPAGLMHLPSIWDHGPSLTPRCNCPESLAGWCRHTQALAGLWMKQPWSFESEEVAPTTPLGTLEPCRRSSRGLDRLDGFVGFLLQHGLLRAPVAQELQAIAGSLLAEGLDRMASRLARCADHFAALGPAAAPAERWDAVEQLLEALRAAAVIRRLMARERLVETVHDEWLGSITHQQSCMPVRHRRYLEVGRARFVPLGGAPILKRYWIDLTSGEAVSDELPEEERVSVQGGAQLLRLRRGDLHPGFSPRWLEALQGQEEDAGPAEVSEGLDRFVRGTAALLEAWRRRLALEAAPEDWVGGVSRISLITGDDGRVLLDDGRDEPLPLGGDWPRPADLPPGVLGAFGRLLLTSRGPEFFPLSLVTGEEVLLAPVELPYPRGCLLVPTAADDERAAACRTLAPLVEALLAGIPGPARWTELLRQLEPSCPGISGGPAAGGARPAGPVPGAADVAAAWERARELLLGRLGGRR